MLAYQIKQAGFAAHLRHPQLHVAPEGVEERRLNIYRELFFNNIHNFISSGFPVLKSLHTDDEWDALVRDFFANHKAQTPYFLEISEEFLKWLDDESLPIHQHFPFAKELAHYEWVELALDVADIELSENIDSKGDLFQGKPAVSPLAMPLVYHWPVHRIAPDFQPQSPSEEPVCLIVYRDGDDKVRFMQANAGTLRLLEILNSEPPLTGLQALQQVANEMPQIKEELVFAHGMTTLKHLQQEGVLQGAYHIL